MDNKTTKRFMEKVEIGTGPPGSVCWEWTANRNDEGYGNFWLNGRLEKAHRVSWMMAEGPIPSGIHVLHACDNR